MPYPYVPPDPDQPQPALKEATSKHIVFSLTLKGMKPWSEQKLHTFDFANRAGAVYVPNELNATDYLYGGFGIGDLDGVTSDFDWKFVYTDPSNPSHNGSKSDPPKLDSSSTTFGAKVTTVTHSTAGSKVSFAVSYILPAGTTGWLACAIPHERKMPGFNDLSAYQAASDMKAVSGTSGSVALKVTPGTVDSYAIFLARKQSGVVIPESAPVIHAV